MNVAKTLKKVLAIMLIFGFLVSLSSCNSSKCNCPKFSIEVLD
ncbi:MAG: hypothetical protein AAF502_03040 [Bacteroidota bacterium]